jgi:hypothetical protein
MGGDVSARVCRPGGCCTEVCCCAVPGDDGAIGTVVGVRVGWVPGGEVSALTALLGVGVGVLDTTVGIVSEGFCGVIKVVCGGGRETGCNGDVGATCRSATGGEVTVGDWIVACTGDVGAIRGATTAEVWIGTTVGEGMVWGRAGGGAVL